MKKAFKLFGFIALSMTLAVACGNANTTPAEEEVVVEEQAAEVVEEAEVEIVDEKDEKIAQLEQQAAENLDKYQRTLAEFDNFRKRTEKEKSSSPVVRSCSMLRSFARRYRSSRISWVSGGISFRPSTCWMLPLHRKVAGMPAMI